MAHFQRKQAHDNTYYTYTYTTNHKISNNEHSQLSNSRYSTYSNISAFKSLNSTCRINELKPKSKIVISNCSTHAYTKRKESQEGQSSPSKISYDNLSPTRRQSTIVTQSIEYNNIKPMFNWNKLTFLCGFERQTLGENGCMCNESCGWKKQWIKGFHVEDEKTFKRLLRENVKKENAVQIDKDIKRTHPECPTFSKNVAFQKMLRNVLVAYSVYDVDIGYVQGINMITGVLLYHIKNQEQTFWALVEMMQYQELRMIYLQNFQYLKIHCRNIDNIIMSKVNDLYNHMIELQIISGVFLNGWLLSLMSNSIPMEYMHQVLDKFKKKGWNYIYKLIITYLLFLKDYLLMSCDQAEFLQFLNVQNSRNLTFQWKQMINSSQKLNL